MYKYGYNRASACACMHRRDEWFVRGPQTHDGVPILLLSLGPGGPIPTGSPKFYDNGLRPLQVVFLFLVRDVSNASLSGRLKRYLLSLKINISRYFVHAVYKLLKMLII